MKDAWPLQQAVYLALAGDAALKAEIGDPPRLYDDAPANAAFPYVLLGETRTAPLAGCETGFEHDLRFHVFSKHGGRRELKRILAALYDALHDADLDIEGARLVSMRFVFSDIFRRDPQVYAGAARFRAVTEESA
ncbi:MAG: DUF3168 domain-containing protein [Amphiplicatus sp.]